ncbi:MAG: hypothetical protein HUU37_05020 [Bdellovibrionales bacterium]|nr:hypothetical protein [Bdellovibrionales bacterium]
MILAPILVVPFVLAAFAVGSLSLRATATDYRLQVCARKITASRENLHGFLGATNRAMAPLQSAVYLARGLSFVPGAVAASAIGEKAALAALKNIQLSQEARIKSHQIQEYRLLLCAPTKRSRNSAFCLASPTAGRKSFARETTLFGDVPGRIRWLPASLGGVRCHSGSRAFQAALDGPQTPELGGWRHLYGARP